MKNNNEIENIFYKYISLIKTFNESLIKYYNLSENPYNSSGKLFPKIGSILIDRVEVKYRFHGRGCTFFWNELEIFFNVDPNNRNPIIITPGGVYTFLNNYSTVYNTNNFSEKTEELILDFTQKSILILERYLGAEIYYLNEEWYKSFKILDNG